MPYYGRLVPGVPVDACGNCGERYLDPEAIEILTQYKRRRRAG